MTYVNVSTTKAETVILEETSGSVTAVQTEKAAVVTTVTEGPQGPPGPQGPSGLIVNDAGKVDKSLVYYDAAAATFKADATWTTKTIVDAGNF